MQGLTSPPHRPLRRPLSRHRRQWKSLMSRFRMIRGQQHQSCKQQHLRQMARPRHQQQSQSQVKDPQSQQRLSSKKAVMMTCLTSQDLKQMARCQRLKKTGAPGSDSGKSPPAPLPPQMMPFSHPDYASSPVSYVYQEVADWHCFSLSTARQGLSRITLLPGCLTCCQKFWLVQQPHVHAAFAAAAESTSQQCIIIQR